jgi:uncharacterized membrane protein YraQ (UPF0718 family)
MLKYLNLKNIFISLFIIFLLISNLLEYHPGKIISDNTINFGSDMLKILPCIFILIGLFHIWIKRSTIEKHLGQGSGIRGYIFAILLAGTTVGGMYVAFPVAYALYKKGAKLSVLFTYISASGSCRISMTIFEASFLGIKFTLIRLLISIPLIIITSILLGRYLSNKNFKLKPEN